ncbi:MAG: nucleotidyltransferase domain-containing protein [Ignavibacteriae bacterium]|nr:nucleotidyltransferase domain-containing protein [Ignavibacteriota bacterium]
MELIEQSKIQEIVERIVKNYNPDKVILFGSYAQGTATERSDVDLLIVKDSPLPRHQRGSEVRRYLYGTFVPMDILVYTNDELEEFRDVTSSFINTVMKTGKILYERN